MIIDNAYTQFVSCVYFEGFGAYAGGLRTARRSAAEFVFNDAAEGSPLLHPPCHNFGSLICCVSMWLRYV